jgi:hypothetical protein
MWLNENLGNIFIMVEWKWETLKVAYNLELAHTKGHMFIWILHNVFIPMRMGLQLLF